jgi:hypothetical protein
MLLEGRIAEPEGQRRVLEQVRDVLARIAQLSHQASEAAGWIERSAERAGDRVDAHEIVAAAFAAVHGERSAEARNEIAPGAATIATIDRGALVTAVASVLAATVRERPGRSTVMVATLDAVGSQLEILAGSPEECRALGAGPQATSAGPIGLERGGLGLTLVNASIVLETHRAVMWTVGRQRSVCAIRIPVEA